MKLKKNSNHNLGYILFFCIFISYIPYLISTVFIPDFRNGLLFYISVGVIFLIQILILLMCFSNISKIVININILFFAWLFMFSQVLTLFYSTISDIQVNNFDYINIFSRFLSIVIFIGIALNYGLTKKGINNFMFAMVLFGIISCLYNFAINYKGILSITTVTNPNDVNYSSFFTNRNSFGQLLFFSIIANTYLFINRKSFFYILNYLIFSINIVATFSRTVVASTLIFLLLFYFFYYRKKILFQIITLYSLIIAILIIYFNPKVNSFIESFSRIGSGTSGRVEIWEAGIQILNSTSWFLGIGYLTSANLIKEMGFPSEFHNFFIETLVGGGVIELMLQIGIFIFLFINIINIYHKDRITGILYISSLVALLFYSLFESASFFSMGYVDTLFRVFYFTIPLMYARYLLSNEDCKKSN